MEIQSPSSSTIYEHPNKIRKTNKNDLESQIEIYVVEPIQGKWGELDPQKDHEIIFTKKIQ